MTGLIIIGVLIGLYLVGVALCLTWSWDNDQPLLSVGFSVCWPVTASLLGLWAGCITVTDWRRRRRGRG